MDPAALEKLGNHIRTKFRSSLSLLVVRGGYIVHEEYFHGSGPQDLNRTACVTKSFISALVGIAISQGRIGGVEDKVLDYFPQRAGRDMHPFTAGMTLRHLLTNTTGWYWPHRRRDSGGGDEAMIRRWFRSRDYVQFLLALPFKHEPGAVFNYNSACSWLLGAVLDRTAEDGMLAFAERHLFGPIGITRRQWDADPRGQRLLGWGLHLRPRDMARFGYLYLNGGLWEGREIVPAQWVAESTERHTPEYGYLWWIGSAGGHRSFMASGGRGQLIAAVPDLDLVVVITCKSSARSPNYVVGEYVAAAAK